MPDPLAPLEIVTSHSDGAPTGPIQYPNDQKLAALSTTSSSDILTFEQFRAGYSRTPHIREGFEGIEILYRNNVLWARATLFKHCVGRSVRMDYADPGVVETVRKDISSYANAVAQFRDFRSSSKIMFKHNEILMQVGEYLSYLDTKKRETARLPTDSEAATSAYGNIALAEQSLYRYYAANILPDHEAGVSQELASNAKRGLNARLAMALGGGLALIVPMLIMVLHPTQVKSLVVTCVFVIAVAVGLAEFMDTAEPKDIIASVAGYAAVLVVFVGLNVPTESA